LKRRKINCKRKTDKQAYVHIYNRHGHQKNGDDVTQLGQLVTSNTKKVVLSQRDNVTHCKGSDKEGGAITCCNVALW